MSITPQTSSASPFQYVPVPNEHVPAVLTFLAERLSLPVEPVAPSSRRRTPDCRSAGRRLDRPKAAEVLPDGYQDERDLGGPACSTSFPRNRAGTAQGVPANWPTR